MLDPDSAYETSCYDVTDEDFTENFKTKMGDKLLQWSQFKSMAPDHPTEDYCTELARFFVRNVPACFIGNIRELCCGSCQNFARIKYPDECYPDKKITQKGKQNGVT